MNNWMKSLTNIGLPQSFHITYIVEILILTVIIYELLIWVKNTRAWTLLKGIVVVTVFALGSSDNTDMDHVEDRRCACDGCCDCFSA